MPPLVLLLGCSAGLVLQNMDKSCIDPLESWVPLTVRLCSPAPWHRQHRNPPPQSATPLECQWWFPLSLMSLGDSFRCPQFPHNVAEACQSWRPWNIRSLEELMVNLIQSWDTTIAEWPLPQLTPKSCHSASCLEYVWVGLRSSLKHSFLCPTISSVELTSSLPPPYIVWTKYHFLLQSRDRLSVRLNESLSPLPHWTPPTS